MNSKSDSLKSLRYPETVNLACPRCANPSALKVGQVDFRGQLRWFESVNCDNCGLVTEADGFGFPSPDLRNIFLKLDGEWCVIMPEVSSTAVSISVLRSALSLDIKTALALLKTEKKIIFRGTRSESIWLGRLLEDAGESPILKEAH